MVARHLIDGRWVAHGDVRSTVDPATGEQVGLYHSGDIQLVGEVIEAVRRAFDSPGWSMRTRLRAEVLHGFASELFRRSEDLSNLIIKENGKIRREVAGCTVVIKPATQTTSVNSLVMKCLQAAQELPRGVVNLVNDDGNDAVSKALVESPPG